MLNSEFPNFIRGESGCFPGRNREFRIEYWSDTFPKRILIYSDFPPVQRLLRAARSTAFPRRYTVEIRRVLVMFSSGLASRTRKSALFPAATVPRSLSFSTWAAFRVAAGSYDLLQTRSIHVLWMD